MVLPGYALIAQGVQIHAGAWPGGSFTRQLILSRAFAMQATAYVVMAGGLLRQQDIPEEYREVVMECNGESGIISPSGDMLAGPLLDGEGILTATGNLGTLMTNKLIADHAGHYTRPDVFDFRVNRTPKRIATFIDEPQAEVVRAGLNGGLERREIRTEIELRGAFEDLATAVRD